MEMDEDMEIESMELNVKEIDLEYEFDASRWYDFSRLELPVESQAAEFWFHTAPSYPPSPFVTKLLLDVCDEKSEEEASVRSEDGDMFQYRDATDSNKPGNGMSSGIFKSLQGSDNLKKVTPYQSICKGATVSNHKFTDKSKFRSKASVRATPRGSTLMRPTASQLAKQSASRLHMQMDSIPEKGVCGSSGNEVQAAKRQKLDGGLLRKVAETKTEMNFIHKAPKKDTTLDRNANATLDRNVHPARTKITVPHEPDFATSQRAIRIRKKNDSKLEQDSTAVYRFKARPFNRKIFDAPSLPIWKKSTPKLPEFHEFHLKTSERAMQHSSTVTARSHQRNDVSKGPEKSSLLDGVNRDSRRPIVMDTPKHDVSEGSHVFKARPLNKKILSSRVDTGVFKNSKRETTVPLEFSFQSERRPHADLPTDLFSKLSIKSELQPNNGPRARFPQPKGLKENRVNLFQSGNERPRTASGKPVSSQQIPFGNNEIIPETNQQRPSRRNLGIR